MEELKIHTSLPNGVKIALQRENDPDCVAVEFVKAAQHARKQGKKSIWGLPVGPTSHHEPLIRLFESERLDLSNVVTFNLDEYLDGEMQWIPESSPISFRGIIQQTLFDELDRIAVERSIPKENRRFPDPNACDRYTDLIRWYGGLDLCFLGLGLDGHIAFNEPIPSTKMSSSEYPALTTRTVALHPKTIIQNFARYFVNRMWEPEHGLAEIPTHAVTMGMREILSARRIIMRPDSFERGMLRRILFDPPTPELPASYLQHHPDCVFLVNDRDAAEIV